jgi:cytochrome c-type biogenesis protein CcmH/NrfG
VREQGGDLTGAAADARQAARREPDNWRNWLVLSRLEARTGHPQASVTAFRHARKLNPNHPLLRR